MKSSNIQAPSAREIPSAKRRGMTCPIFVKTLETILPLRSIGWRGEGRGEVRFLFANGRSTTLAPLTLTLTPRRGEGTAAGRATIL